jgi:hypothetical protein
MKHDKLMVRVTALEQANEAGQIIPSHCDLQRRLRRYVAYFKGEPWVCTGSPEQKARREADLARYKEYFDSLEAITNETES